MGSPQRTAGRPRPGQGVARGPARPAGRRADRPLIFDAITVVVSFVVALVLYPPTIRLLTRVRAGQVIQEELPDSHQKKAGTPTGGGTLFVALAMIAGVLATVAGHGGAWQAIAGLAAGGLIGLADDLRKLRIGSLSVPARLKLPLSVRWAVPAD